MGPGSLFLREVRNTFDCLMQFVFQAHLADECPKLPLPCPNKCDKKLEIPRDEVNFNVVSCQFLR